MTPVPRSMFSSIDTPSLDSGNWNTPSYSHRSRLGRA